MTLPGQERAVASGEGDRIGVIRFRSGRQSEPCGSSERDEDAIRGQRRRTGAREKDRERGVGRP